MSDFVKKEIKDIKPSGIRKFFDMASSVKDAIALSVGEPDFDTPWHIALSGIDAIKYGNTFYTSNAGLLELRQEISYYLKSKYQLSYDTDEILVTIGGSEAIDLALRGCLGQGDEIIMTDPGYVSYEPCALLSHGTPVHYVLEKADGFRIKADKLEKLITPKTKILLINYPNNPTGAILEQEDLEALAKVCIKHNLLVVSDEIYSELTYEKKHCSIGAILGMKERTLVINGFSKAFSMTGWRLGYLCGPKEIVKELYKIHQYGIMCAPTISQYAGIEALQNGEKDVIAMREEYELRRNYVVNRLKAMNVDCFLPEGAFYCFLDIRKYGLSSEEFALKLLNKEKVILIPGNAFGTHGEGFLRLSYAYSLEKLKEALNRLEVFIEKKEMIS